MSHTHEVVTLQIWSGLVADMKWSRRRCEWVTVHANRHPFRGRYEWVTSHVRMSHVTHTSESHHTHQWITNMNGSRRRYEWVTHTNQSHRTHHIAHCRYEWDSQIADIDESQCMMIAQLFRGRWWLLVEWVTLCMQISHITHTNQSCNVYEWGDASHKWLSQVEEMNESRCRNKWVTLQKWMSHGGHRVAKTHRMPKVAGLFPQKSQ